MPNTENKSIFMDMPSINSEEMARNILEKYRPLPQKRVHKAERMSQETNIKKKLSELQAAEMLKKYAP